MLDIKIFKWMTPEEVKIILWSLDTTFFEEGQIILKQWEESNKKGYIIARWEVEVDIDEKVVAVLWEGEVFWEIALLSEDARTATIKAIEDTLCYIITQDKLLEIVDNYSNEVNKEIISRIEENLKN